ncbi:MAG: 16S rRNA (adenine(1518)-N(6)/adenine(1519)-N(6))-dimethyltransferase RsmA [Pseudobdellovibrionaceae bacterium]
MKTTQERLKEFLNEYAHFAKKALGQNFLVNDQVVEKMRDALKKTAPDFVFEVGPGPGALTDYLIQDYRDRLLLIELDQALAAVWKSRNASVIEADALKVDWQSMITKHQESHGKNLVLISNLPYQIASTLVIDRSFDTVPLSSMILMFQKEVGDRLRARENTDDYGFLTVVVQSFWKIDVLANLGRRDFFPPPKINSQVLTFERLQDKPYLQTQAEKRLFLNMVKAAFSQRRKVMRKNLGQVLPAAAIKSLYEKLEFSENVRSEEISVVLFHKMFELCQVEKLSFVR